MPLSSKILRGLKVEGWQVYQPKVYRPKVKAITSSLKMISLLVARKQKIQLRNKRNYRRAREEAAKLHKRLLEEAHQEAGLKIKLSRMAMLRVIKRVKKKV